MIVIIVIIIVIIMSIILGLQRYPSQDSGDQIWERSAGDRQVAT